MVSISEKSGITGLFLLGNIRKTRYLRSQNRPKQKNPEKFKYKNKFCFAAQSAAVLMNALKRQRDAFGLTLFDDQIRVATGCKSSTVHYRLLLSHLIERIENPQLQRATDLAATLHNVAEATHRRSMIVIFTDVMERPEQAEAVFSALQHLRHNKHEVILFHVTDKSKELDFEFENRPYFCLLYTSPSPRD